MTSSDETKASFATKSRWIRSIMAVLLLLAALTMLVLRVYEDRVVIVEHSSVDTVTTTTYSGPTLTSPIVLFSILLIVAVLWPDIAEFNVFGVGLKMKVQAVAKEAEAARQEIAATKESLHSLQVQIVRSEAAAIAQSTNITNVNVDAIEVAERVREALRESNQAGGAQPVVTKDRDALIGQVVTNWAELRSLLRLTDRLSLPVNLSKEPNSRAIHDARHAFIDEKLSEIRAARDLRNIAAHNAQALDTTDLQYGAELLTILLAEAQNSLPIDSDDS